MADLGYFTFTKKILIFLTNIKQFTANQAIGIADKA